MQTPSRPMKPLGRIFNLPSQGSPHVLWSLFSLPGLASLPLPGLVGLQGPPPWHRLWDAPPEAPAWKEFVPLVLLWERTWGDSLQGVITPNGDHLPG